MIWDAISILLAVAGSAADDPGNTPVFQSPPPVPMRMPPVPMPPPVIMAPPRPPAPLPNGYQPGRPAGNPAYWIYPDDYPPIAIFDEVQGTSGFRLSYGIDGRVTRCEITASSGSALLDGETCRLLTRRARFVAGLANGKPVGGTYSNRVRWTIPDRGFLLIDQRFGSMAYLPAELTAPAFGWTGANVYPKQALAQRPSVRTIVTVDIDPTGHVSDCKLEMQSGKAAFDRASCPALLGKRMFKPATDESGVKVADRVRIKLRWEPPPTR